ncbi:thymidylate synthase [Hydrogenovibrio sp. SC-1]|uniref:thymidylate synthase n=1 Tax=Hydrogenovibrio sp. SC-1 TaxID=2065820 RepID=UPI000C7AC5CC|nr:thymidylate synthase [Hydrogenovibrio sp. SC-1]PLA73424.1 thymidylate synthase [Hydrogenovibrio sp. SC-1]
MQKYFEADTLDDLMFDVFKTLLSSENKIEATRGLMTEILGATLVLKNPRSRLSRSETKGKVFSAFGELFWYLTGQNRLDFIVYYVGRHYVNESDDEETVRSGYGERLFNSSGSINQVSNVIELLLRKPNSRQAVIQLFDATDINQKYKSIPCTCTLQFLLRNGKLNLFVNMRSNDVFLGLPHDIFSFTMLQEIVARSIGVDIGVYQHSVGSLHLYENRRADAKQYLSEGFYEETSMKPMPEGDPWSSIEKVRKIEEQIRAGSLKTLDSITIDPYWKDVCRVLLIHRYFKDENWSGCKQLKLGFHDQAFNIFVEDRLARKQDSC